MDRRKLAAERNWETSEIYKARDAWRQLYRRQPSSSLTFTEYLEMIEKSGLRPNSIGLRHGQYNLARLGDAGPYSRDNCRFIPVEENMAERKEGYQRETEFRRKMSELAKLRPRKVCPVCGASASPGMLARWHGANCTK